VVLNIGCGTSDALVKRPAIASFVENFLSLYSAAPFELHLAGAGFEKDANTQFARLFETRMASAGLDCLVKDWAGELSIEESAALLDCADLVVSTDSGPYHMAVALGVPTLCWFKFDTLPSVHAQAGVICLTEPLPAAFTSAALELLNFDSGG
jgi:ADP-heptose:LPS heptosyltransferase